MNISTRKKKNIVTLILLSVKILVICALVHGIWIILEKEMQIFANKSSQFLYNG